MRRVFLLGVVAIAAITLPLVAIASSAASTLGAIEVSVTSPVSSAHSLAGVVPVMVTASADAGIYSVQLEVDGAPYGAPDQMPVAPYDYRLDWDTSGLTPGNHTLAVLATDWSSPDGGVQQLSAPVTVDVGPAYPTAKLTSPTSWSFVNRTIQIVGSVTSAIDPSRITYAVDSTPLPSPTWDTTTVSNGSHTVSVTATDGRGKAATDSATVTVDNTPPSVSVTSPTPGGRFLDSLDVSAAASDAFGIGAVQFMIDGQPATVTATPSDWGKGYVYSQTLSLAGLSHGDHLLTAVATDAAGNATTSAPVPFTVGTPLLAATLTTPPDWTFASKTTTVGANVTGGVAPYSARLYLDGTTPTGVAATAVPYSIAWDTTKTLDGSHAIKVVVTDAAGTTVSTATVHVTVDNQPPAAVMYQPTSGARITANASLQVHASDANGVGSVQFTVDGKPVGALLTVPDSGQQYLYTTNLDTTTIPPGVHTASAVVSDAAGNVTVAKAVSITTGPLQYLPVLNYHGIDTVPSDKYELTPAEADQQLAYLKANGYQSVTLEQYQRWLAGLDIGVAKPVLITVDDGLHDQLAWDPLLQKYGFKAVLFVVTGFADNMTPGDADPRNNLSWPAIQALAANGRWQIAFHAGLYGHGDAYNQGAKIGDQSYTATCPYFYSCLSQRTAGNGKNKTTTVESVSDFKQAVTNEMTAGIAELKQKVPSASLVAWAAPFNDAGQWTNLFNDPSGQAQNWLPSFMASKFPITFTQTNPTTYAQASGLVGSLTDYGRHYRFEDDHGTTPTQLAAALTDPAFAR